MHMKRRVKDLYIFSNFAIISYFRYESFDLATELLHLKLLVTMRQAFTSHFILGHQYAFDECFIFTIFDLLNSLHSILILI